MSKIIRTFPVKKTNIAKYMPFVRQFWSDQVILSDSLRFSGPLRVAAVL